MNEILHIHFYTIKNEIHITAMVIDYFSKTALNFV